MQTNQDIFMSVWNAIDVTYADCSSMPKFRISGFDYSNMLTVTLFEALITDFDEEYVIS